MARPLPDEPPRRWQRRRGFRRDASADAWFETEPAQYTDLDASADAWAGPKSGRIPDLDASADAWFGTELAQNSDLDASADAWFETGQPYRGRGARARWLLAAAVVVGLAFGVGMAASTSPHDAVQPIGPPGRAIVVDVIDGDTITVDLAGRLERVRLLGIDAPESVHPSVPVQCYGPEASDALAELLPTGTPVDLRRDVESRDRYGRLLADVDRAADGLNVNRWLVGNGFADTSVYEPNTALVPLLARARREARSIGAGLWGSCEGPDQPRD